jgi:hypothetical protein
MKKARLGGTVSYKVQIAPYESLEVSGIMEIEYDFDDPDDLVRTETAINEKLKAQINKRMEMAVKNYHENIERLKKLV